ncbi:MAG: hypothetical protein Q7R98_00130 [Candidatus Jorgensenbacteria bacterium]|nr:hypothetical protein [Candidatus Jorgensenbacteria bacterium]
MKRVCSFCEKDLGETEPKKEGITHGMCDECFEKSPEERNQMAREIMEKGRTEALAKKSNLTENVKT